MINRLKELKAEAILFLMTIIWGGTFILTKNALNDISSMLYVGIRFSILRRRLRRKHYGTE